MSFRWPGPAPAARSLADCDQIAGAAEIGDHLADGQTRAEAVVDHGIVQAARGEAAAVVGAHAGQAAECGRALGRRDILWDLVGRRGREPGGVNLRIILHGQRFGVGQRQVHGGWAWSGKPAGQPEDTQNRMIQPAY